MLLILISILTILMILVRSERSTSYVAGSKNSIWELRSVLMVAGMSLHSQLKCLRTPTLWWEEAQLVFMIQYDLNGTFHTSVLMICWVKQQSPSRPVQSPHNCLSSTWETSPALTVSPDNQSFLIISVRPSALHSRLGLVWLPTLIYTMPSYHYLHNYHTISS